MKVLKRATKNTIFYYLICLVVITINLPKHSYNSLTIICLGCFWLFSGNLKLKLNAFFKNKKALLYSSLYIVYLISLLYSDDKVEGLKALRLKLPILLFPLFFAQDIRFSKKQKSNFIIVFCASTIVLILYTFFLKIFRFTEIKSLGYIDNYFHSNLTVDINNHPTYLSFTILLCLFFLLKYRHMLKINRYMFLGILFLLSSYLILLSSKIAIAFFFVASILFTYNHFKSKVLFKYIGVGLIIILSAFIFLTNNKISNRFSSEIKNINNFEVINDKNVSFLNKSQRVIATDIFFSQPYLNFFIGVGIGDVQNYLDVKYRYYLETKYRNMFKGLNYHNQYYETISATGVLGGLILIFSFFFAFPKLNSIHSWYIIMIAVFFFTESFLETHRGVMLYSFFHSVFVFLFRKE